MDTLPGSGPLAVRRSGPGFVRCWRALNCHLSYDSRIGMRSILQFLDFFDSNTRCQESRWNDTKTLLFNLAQFMRR